MAISCALLNHWARDLSELSIPNNIMSSGNGLEMLDAIRYREHAEMGQGRALWATLVVREAAGSKPRMLFVLRLSPMRRLPGPGSWGRQGHRTRFETRPASG